MTAEMGTAGNDMVQNPMQNPEPDFISLREILAMVLRHRWAIVVFAVIASLAAGIYFFMQPRAFEAELYLQVIMPCSTDGRVDQGLFETKISSHLQRLSAAHIVKKMSKVLAVDVVELNRKIKVVRQPKTDLLRLSVRDVSSSNALNVVSQWLSIYQEAIQKYNISVALAAVAEQSQAAQAAVMEARAGLEQLKIQVAQTAPLVTLSRAVDDRQLWSELAEKPNFKPEDMQKLADIHIKGEELNLEYVQLKNLVFAAEKYHSISVAKRDFLRNVARLLEASRESNGAVDKMPSTTNVDDEGAVLYVQSILKNTEVVPFGTPGVIMAPRGALKNTALVFLGSLMLGCFIAYLGEWGRGLLSA